MIPLTQSERLEGSPIDCSRDRQAVIALEIGERCARRRSHHAIDSIAVISKALELSLNTRDHLARIHVLIAIDRLVVGIGAVVGIVAVGRIPIVVVPVVISATEKREPAVAASPPSAIVTMAIEQVNRAKSDFILRVCSEMRRASPVDSEFRFLE